MAYTEINDLYDRVYTRFENEDLISKAEVLQMIANAPVADVVEVVRCKECKHYHKEYHFKDEGWCVHNCYTGTDDHFCSYGKRKEGAEK